jgi:hypothetical protein
MDLMSFLGQAAAKSGRVDELQQIFMETEGWISMTIEDKPIEIRPSEDPEKKEVLIISAVQAKERKKYLKVFEVRRDSTEQVVSVEEFIPDVKKKDETVDVPLLDAFVQGFQTPFRTKFN